MKLLILATIVTCLVTGVALGQNSKQSNSLDQRIRKLEQEESDAVLHSDVAALEKLWAEDFTVNNPQNQISRGRKEVLDRVRSGLINYSSFVREIESIGFFVDTLVVIALRVI